jgi:hypothetical protein
MKRRYFNLVEVALAIGILVVGLTTVIVLFPLGLQEARDAVGENYSSETADSMFAFIARLAYDNWATVYAYIPTSKPSSALTSTTGWSQLEGDIYYPGAGFPGVLGLKVTSAGGSIVDFTGEALLWKSQISNITVAGVLISELSYNDAMALHLEISWPVEKPYSERRKNTYYFEIFNYNK